MARIQPDDISDFSILKDASAASVYGARGANGVVLINEGNELPDVEQVGTAVASVKIEMASL